MFVFTLIASLCLCYFSKINAVQQRSLYRSPNGDVNFLNLRKLQHQYLWAEKVTSSMVEDEWECPFHCVEEPKCMSMNVAASPDSNDLHLCELLATDKYRATEGLHANSTFHHYSPWSLCESSPCKNGADCVPDYQLNSYHCDCRAGFAGPHCERRGKSCSEVKSHHLNASSGSYVIDPDGEEGDSSFTVYCNMTDKNGVGVTVISHDSEDRTLVDGYAAPGSYARPVQYTGVSSASQLAGLTHVSAHCEQFIRYECKNTPILYNNNPAYGWLVSRDGIMMKYWGGVTSDDYKCACGLTNSCADPSDGCNCDKDDSVWREDHGFLTKKSDLPVSELRFGDTDSSVEQGYHTLGKLKCYGQA